MSNPPDCAEHLDKVRDIEGFPVGEDEDICALSDPPYYTAYPNPHIADFIAQYATPYDEETDDYHREPFVSDVSVGKRDAMYGAHAYHTKVPYKAIMPFIEHYTKRDGVVFDGFCGTGMTGVAAQILGREAILCDIASAATFIAANYNRNVDKKRFLAEKETLLDEVREECAWLYETSHVDGQKGHINFTVWSDVFSCPYCHERVVFWDAAVDVEKGKVHRNFACSVCSAELTKRDLSYATTEVLDSVLNERIETNIQVPVLINYTVDGNEYEKRPDQKDLELIERINASEIPYWFPSSPMMFTGEEWGDQWRAGYHKGITNVHHFYTRRNLWVLSALWAKLPQGETRHFWMHVFTGAIQGLSKLQRYRPKSTFPNMILSGTLYIGSITREWNAYEWFEGKARSVERSLSTRKKLDKKKSIISTQAVEEILIPANSVDYIFTDPPFGDNLAYSELNFIWESWLQVFTNNNKEAIISRAQKKDLDDYRRLMTKSFKRMYEVLKPGHWITVVFHNSKASVWNSIQDALARAGFVVAQVTALDKQQGSFNQVTAATAVKNDLIINAYKPRRAFEDSFLASVGLGQESEFVAQHLEMLPPTTSIERTREMLYSKMLAYYIRHGYEINMDSPRFYRMLGEEFVDRDGYWFRDEAQAQEYEQRKLKPGSKKAAEQAQGVLFITDERSAIAWLHQFLGDRPKSYSEIYTAYTKALQTSEDQIPEPMQLLEETCVQVNGHWKRPDRLTAEELEERRRQRLLRQFDEYRNQARSGQTLKDVRKEAILTGFEEAYRDKRFGDIVKVGEKLDQRVIDSSTEIFDFIDIAETKMM